MSNNAEVDAITYAIAYAKDHHDDYLAEFIEFLKIPSVSTDSAYAQDIRQAADWIQDRLETLGFEMAAVMPTKGHPVVYGRLPGAEENLPTVLLYAHYDVQPIDPIELWDSPPFEPTIKEGKLYARGVSDDKFGVIAILKAIDAIKHVSGAMPFHVKVLFEGEEETGSPNLEDFVRQHAEMFAADLLVVCDGGHPPENPSYMYSVRGIVAGEVFVTGPARDFHSGIGGGSIRNPLHIVADIISSFQDDTGHVVIPGFYEGIVPLTDEEKVRLSVLDEHQVALTKETSGEFQSWRT